MKTKLFLTVISVFILSSLCVSGQEIMEKHYKKVLSIGAHPDDSEYMCAGTMMKLAEQGCEVVSVYFTCGEAGIEGKTHDEAKQIRIKESEDACKIMGVRAVFMTQVDGSSEVNAAAYEEMLALIEREKPDMVITHWPLDSHRDHRNCFVLVYDAWRQTDHSFDLYYTEVTTSNNTSNFAPDTYVDITSFHDRKYEAIAAHRSQRYKPFEEDETIMERLRGMEYHCRYAESFIKQR